MSNPTAAVNPGSFRDRDGRVYHFQERIFRGLSEAALENFRQLQEKPFYTRLVESGKVIGTRELAAQDNPLPLGDDQFSRSQSNRPPPKMSETGTTHELSA